MLVAPWLLSGFVVQVFGFRFCLSGLSLLTFPWPWVVVVEPLPPHYLYGRDRRPGTVALVVGRSLVAGLVSAALLAPPLWLLWELLPK